MWKEEETKNFKIKFLFKFPFTLGQSSHGSKGSSLLVININIKYYVLLHSRQNDIIVPQRYIYK